MAELLADTAWWALLGCRFSVGAVRLALFG
jgi:hypothetical protein